MSSKIHSTHSPATQNAAQHSDSTVPAESPDTAASRRRFLTTSSAIAGGVFAASAAPRVHAAGDARGSTIKIGVVGCGGRGSGAIRNALNAGKDVKLVAVADLFEENVTSAVEGVEEQAKTIYKGQVDVPPERRFTGFDCYQQMLGKTDVDVVLLTSPPAYRPAQIEAAVAAGKHVFCEKPIATDPTGVRRVMAACQAAKEKNLNIVSGLCWRYDTGVKETMKRIHDGAIGEIITAQSNYLAGPVWVRPKKENETEMHYQCRNWYYFTWLSGD
ncbi:MAG: Gfo/Idh/MocA family oxidoreductase, partial [Planctomycetota bacterium]